MARREHSFATQSVITGLLGAAAVAAWFFVLDLIAGRPFSTPSILGQVLLFGQTEPIRYPPVWSAVIAYTALHVATFAVFGVLLAWLVKMSGRNMLALFALFVTVVTFEVFFYGMVLMLFEGTDGVFPAWQVFGANTLALLVMGAYLLPRHPEIKRRLSRQPLGA